MTRSVYPLAMASSASKRAWKLDPIHTCSAAYSLGARGTRSFSFGP